VWGARVITRLAGLLCLCGVVDGPRAATRTACDAASAALDWPAVLAACGPDTADGARPRGRMQHAWAQLYRGRHDEALVETAALYDSSERAEARFLGGWILVNRADPARIEEGRRLLWDALGLFAAAANAQRVADTASALVHVALEQRQLDGVLELARKAVRFADATSDPGRRGSALTTLAATYDVIGRAEEARVAFGDAAEILATRPADLAWAYLKHAVFLLELRTPADARNALTFLDAAARNAGLAVRAGQAEAERVAGLGVSIPFNRAAALSTLGRDDEALALLAALPSTEHDHPMFQLITGTAAARRGDTNAALAHLGRLPVDEVSSDYAVSVEVELAHVYRAQDRLVDAERALRRAIERVESLRVRGSLELRPWILAHRATPYEALIELLAEQDRAADALAVIESLHARAWLDATTTTAAAAPAVPADPAPGPPRSPAATAPLDRAVLLERLGDREALVFLDLGSTAWRAHVAGGVVRVERVPATAFAAVDAFRGAPDDLVAAAAAAALLLPPELTAGDRPLTIVASGRFSDLPFPALRRGSRLLIDDRAIARLPGLAAMQCQLHAAGGPPVFIGNAAGDLPHAAAEVRALAAAHHVPARLGAAATRAAVLASRDAAWLPLAGHGEVGPEGGALSLRDGSFAAAAVLREQLAPAVVVLAGCSTATGADLESWSGFPSAFLAAGSRFVIATTRSVADAAAAAVVQAFYAQPAALDPIARLAAAQRVVAARVPATTWASFAAWGVSGCGVDAVLPGH
jgi:tetratricopeptide (TPR) repeat protein